jgi:hypothetical protein
MDWIIFLAVVIIFLLIVIAFCACLMLNRLTGILECSKSMALYMEEAMFQTIEMSFNVKLITNSMPEISDELKEASLEISRKCNQRQRKSQLD